MRSNWQKGNMVTSSVDLSMRFRIFSGVAGLCLAFALLVGCSKAADKSSSFQSAPGTKTKIILLRHAEKNLEQNEEVVQAKEKVDMGLAPKGKRRAQALVDAIGDMGVTAIYCPALRRNIQTAQPLADHLGLKLNLVSKSRLLNSKKLAKDLLDEFLTKQAGGVVVWVGDTWNLREIYEMLDGTGSPPVEYGDLFIIMVPDIGTLRIKKSSYGE